MWIAVKRRAYVKLALTEKVPFCRMYGKGWDGELTRCLVHSAYVHPEEGNFIRTTFLSVLLMSKRCFLSVCRGRMEGIVLYH